MVGLKPEMRLPFGILCLVPFIMVLGNSMLIPLLPQLRAAMGLSVLQGGLIITVFSIPAGLTIPVAGLLSDRFGRKVIMAPALILYGIGGLVAGFAALWLESPFWILILGRIVQGIGAGGTYQLAMALTGDIFQSNERAKALGLLESFNGVGKVVSPIAGSALGMIVWFAPFFVYGFLAIPVGIAVWLLVKERKHNRTRQPINNYLGQVVLVFKKKGWPLLACFLSGMVVLFILFGILSYLSDVLEQRYQVRGIGAGLLIAIPVTAMAFTSYLTGTYLGKKAGDWMRELMTVGLLIVAVAVGVSSFLKNIYLFFLAMIALGIGTGAVLPAVNTLITSAASTEERGMVTCLYGSVRFFGVAMGPPAFGLAPEMGQRTIFLAAGALAAAVAVMAFGLVQERKLLPPELLKGG